MHKETGYQMIIGCCCIKYIDREMYLDAKASIDHIIATKSDLNIVPSDLTRERLLTMNIIDRNDAQLLKKCKDLLPSKKETKDLSLHNKIKLLGRQKITKLANLSAKISGVDERPKCQNYDICGNRFIKDKPDMLLCLPCWIAIVHKPRRKRVFCH